MNDPVADLLLEAEQGIIAEREERTLLLERVTELRAMIAELAIAIAALANMERAEQGDRMITITERDEFGRIKSFRVN